MRTQNIVTLLTALRKEGAHAQREITAWVCAQRRAERPAFSQWELAQIADNAGLRGVELTVKGWEGIELPALQLAVTEQLNEWKEDSKVEIARLNLEALNALRETLGQKMDEKEGWRPTVPTSGSITGLWEGIICHATNGILGVFTWSGGDCQHSWLGHVAEFNWQEDKEILNHDGTTEWESVWRKGPPPTRFGTPRPAPERRAAPRARRSYGMTPEQQALFDSL